MLQLDCPKKQAKDQKRLLVNISKIHTSFENEHPDKKIGFSTFALLRPKWCILVGAAGTYVCVCTYHQNVKIMLGAMNSPTDYKQIMEICVCNLENPDCVLQHCDSCPDSLVLKEFFVKELLKTFGCDDTIRFNQWVSTDRGQFVEQESAFDDFVDDLVEKFLKLTEHHYIGKQQRIF